MHGVYMWLFTDELIDHVAIGYNEYSVFIIGGAKEDGNITNEVCMFDIVFQKYTQKYSMHEPRYRFGASMFKCVSIFLLFSISFSGAMINLFVHINSKHSMYANLFMHVILYNYLSSPLLNEN